MFVAPRIPWLPETFSSYRVFFPFIFQSLPISLITWWSPINIMICDMHLNSSLNYWTTDLASEFHWELTRLLLIIYNNIVFYLKRLKVTKKISKWDLTVKKKKKQSFDTKLYQSREMEQCWQSRKLGNKDSFFFAGREGIMKILVAILASLDSLV